tara:strand:+ start:385 stop:1305 length:921 start_codon:yes stop_codon:yes gene_type:complete
MNKYNINGNIVSTNLNRNKVYAVTEPRFSYPYSHTNQIRKITQSFVTGSDNVPPYNPNLVHPDFPNAYILKQTDRGVSPTGFVEFTREYIEQLSTNIYSEPTTLMFRFPVLFAGHAGYLRGHDSMITTDQWNTARFLRAGMNKKVTVSERWELIFVGTEMVDIETALQDIPSNSKINYNGYTWNTTSNNGTSLTIRRTDQDGNIITTTTSSGYQYLNPEPDFEKLTITKPWSVYDTYNEGDYDWIDAYEMPANVREVTYCDQKTSPTTEQYLEMVEDKEKVPMAESEIEHVDAYVYLRKTLYGALQ